MSQVYRHYCQLQSPAHPSRVPRLSALSLYLTSYVALPPGDGWWMWRGPADERQVRLGDSEPGAEAIVVLVARVCASTSPPATAR